MRMPRASRFPWVDRQWAKGKVRGMRDEIIIIEIVSFRSHIKPFDPVSVAPDAERYTIYKYIYTLRYFIFQKGCAANVIT